MPKVIKSTLVEVHQNLSIILFNILKELEPEGWQNPNQVVYSTVDDWDTAYHSYLLQNNIEEVKFPFASLTRDPTQQPYAQWNSPLSVHEGPNYKEYEVKGGIVRPVDCKFYWTIYRKDFINLESLADFLIVAGSDTQRFQYYSNILEQNSEFSFHFETPTHDKLPDKEEKIRGRGFIFSLKIPITVNCVLGMKKDRPIIAQIVQKTILENTNIVVDENIIQNPNYPLN